MAFHSLPLLILEAQCAQVGCCEDIPWLLVYAPAEKPTTNTQE